MFDATVETKISTETVVILSLGLALAGVLIVLAAKLAR